MTSSFGSSPTLLMRAFAHEDKRPESVVSTNHHNRMESSRPRRCLKRPQSAEDSAPPATPGRRPTIRIRRQERATPLGLRTPTVLETREVPPA